jgi:hypothetical protein
MANGKESCSSLRTGDRNLQAGGTAVSRACEFCPDRLGIAKKATESTDVEHNSRRAVAFDARGKITRDEDVAPINW